MKISKFDNLDIRSKLTLFLLIPVLAVLYLSYSGFKDKYQHLQNARQVEGFTRISLVLADLVFELQNERGLSAGFMMSDDTRFTQGLSTQRVQTDITYRRFRDKLKELGQANNYWGLNKEFMRISAGLSRLSYMRGRIDKREVNDAFKYFSDLNSQSINLMRHMKVLVADSLLVRLHDTSLLLFWLQERTAQERGVLISVFASGELDAQSFQDFSFYNLDQKRLLREFYAIAPQEQQTLLKEKQSHIFADKVANVQQAIFNKAIKNDLLNELQRLLGFGGLIHDFKNYIIRGNGQHYLQQFQKKSIKAQDIINQYRKIPGLSQKEHADLTVLEQNFNHYESNLWVAAKMKKEGATANIIDQTVKIDDGQAVRALKYLHKILIDLDAYDWWDMATHRVELFNELGNHHGLHVLSLADKTKKDARLSLYRYLVLIFFILFASAIMASLLMQRLVGEVKCISKSIREMQINDDYDQLLNVSGADEIGEMAAAFNSLINERKKSEGKQVRLQRELQQAQKMESLGLLTGGIAHDFNNILATILGFSELGLEISQDTDNEKLADYFNEVLAAGLRGQNLVAQMLTYSRQQEIKDQPLDLSHLLTEDLSLLRSSLPSSITIETDFEENLPLTPMNPTHMNQILLNLSINARDAMNGKGTLSFKLYLAKDLDTVCVASHKIIQGDWLALSASDTGSGIDPDIISEIFDPFYTTKGVGKGTGMGLSVVYGIVRSHGGYIMLESESGKGSTFTLLFPPCMEVHVTEPLELA